MDGMPTGLNFEQEWAEIEAESIGWLLLEPGVYLHAGNPDDDELIITVTGVADAAMAAMNVLLVLG